LTGYPLRREDKFYRIFFNKPESAALNLKDFSLIPGGWYPPPTPPYSSIHGMEEESSLVSYTGYSPSSLEVNTHTHRKGGRRRTLSPDPPTPNTDNMSSYPIYK